MLGWLTRQPTKARRLRDRVLEGMREVGVLFMAFASLDVALSPEPIRDSVIPLLLFLGLGMLLFGGALVFEWRRGDDA